MRARSALGGALGGAGLGDVLAVARAVDVDADCVHREAVENRRGKRGVAEVAPPFAERDVRGDCRGNPAVASIDEVVEGVCGRRLVTALSDLAEADVIDDEEIGTRPALEAARVRSVGEPGVQVVEEIDAACVAHGDALFARAQTEGLEDVALAGAALAGDDEVVVPPHEVEARELEDEGLVDGRLEVPLECLEGLFVDESARVDAAADALLELLGGLESEDVFEQRGRAGALVRGPREALVELGQRARQSEELQVPSQSLGNEAVVCCCSLAVSARSVSFRHGLFSCS